MGLASADGGDDGDFIVLLEWRRLPLGSRDDFRTDGDGDFFGGDAFLRKECGYGRAGRRLRFGAIEEYLHGVRGALLCVSRIKPN